MGDLPFSYFSPPCLLSRHDPKGDTESPTEIVGVHLFRRDAKTGKANDEHLTMAHQRHECMVLDAYHRELDYSRKPTPAELDNAAADDGVGA